MWTLSAFYIPPRHIKTLAIANRERVGLWSVTFSALRMKLCVASVSNRVIARKSGKFCARPNFFDNLARKRMLRRADKGWSVGRWNERVRAERCEVVDCGSNFKLTEITDGKLGLSREYREMRYDWVFQLFTEARKERSRQFYTPHHTSLEERSARFIAQHLSALLRKLSSANPFKLESLGRFLWKRSLVPRVSSFPLAELGRAN